MHGYGHWYGRAVFFEFTVGVCDNQFVPESAFPRSAHGFSALCPFVRHCTVEECCSGSVARVHLFPLSTCAYTGSHVDACVQCGPLCACVGMVHGVGSVYWCFHWVLVMRGARCCAVVDWLVCVCWHCVCFVGWVVMMVSGVRKLECGYGCLSVWSDERWSVDWGGLV